MTSNSDFTAFCIYLTFQHFSLSPSLCLRFLWTSYRPSASSKHSPKLPMRDRLVLLCKLGHGASGVVYKARTSFYSILLLQLLWWFVSFCILFIVSKHLNCYDFLSCFHFMTIVIIIFILYNYHCNYCYSLYMRHRNQYNYFVVCLY